MMKVSKCRNTSPNPFSFVPSLAPPIGLEQRIKERYGFEENIKISKDIITQIIKLPKNEISPYLHSKADTIEKDNKDFAQKLNKPETTDFLDGLFSKCDEFPLDSFPTVVQKYIINKAEQLGSPYDYFGGGILTVFAGAIGTTYGIQLNKGWEEPSILWHVVLAETGSRKTSCFKAIWNIARENFLSVV